MSTRQFVFLAVCLAIGLLLLIFSTLGEAPPRYFTGGGF